MYRSGSSVRQLSSVTTQIAQRGEPGKLPVHCQATNHSHPSWYSEECGLRLLQAQIPVIVIL